VPPACPEYGFKQAIAKHGPPRTYYVALGSAYIADSLVLICAELGIRLLHTGVQDCEAKGVIERRHRT
jgi:transposase InsO family protein